MLCLAAAGCGGGRGGTIDEVKACLSDAGLVVEGGATKPLPGDTNAPDVGELVVPPSGVFIAFSSSPRRADALAGKIARNGEVSRHGAITVLYVSAAELPPLSAQDRADIEACV